MEANQVTIVVTAQDRTQTGFASAQAGGKKLAQSIAGGPQSVAGAYTTAEKSAQGFQGTLRRVGEIAAGVLAAQALQAGARRFVGFIQSGVKAASDLGESVNAVNKVFGESSEEVQKWGRENANAIGLSQRAFNQAATPLGSMLKNQGLALQDVTKHTISLTERAADMASVFNTDVTDALAAIQAGLRGEQDPLERYGVTLSAVAVEARALADTHKTTAAQLTNAEKATARLNLIYDQTASTAGDFRDTSDGLANAQRIATAQMEDAKAKIAAGFVPVMAKAAKLSGDLATRFAELPKGIQSTTTAIVALGAATVLLVPRIAATKEGLVAMGLAGDKATLSLASLARVAGVAALAFGALKFAEWFEPLRKAGDWADNLAVKLGFISQEAADSRTNFGLVFGKGGMIDNLILDGPAATKTLHALAGGVKAVATETKIMPTVVDEATSQMSESWEETFSEFDVLEQAHESALDKLTGKQKLTATEYIKELERMVAEQEAWAANMKKLAGRVPEEMLEELRKLGPAGAEQVALLAKMSDKELQKVIALYLRAGTLSAQEFAAGITGQLGAIEAAASRARIAASRIMQQQRQTGGFEHGGIVGAVSGGARGGTVLVGEGGPEIVNLPYGSMVHPAGMSQAMMNGGNGGGPTMLAFAPGAADDITRLLIHIIQTYVRDAGGNGAALGIRTVG